MRCSDTGIIRRSVVSARRTRYLHAARNNDSAIVPSLSSALQAAPNSPWLSHCPKSKTEWAVLYGAARVEYTNLNVPIARVLIGGVQNFSLLGVPAAM